MIGAFLAGLGIGALAAANVGPIWLLCVRTSARFGWASGAAIGLGAAIVDLSYAVLGALGATALLQFAPLRIGLGLLGAAVLIVIGARTLRDAFRVRQGAEDLSEVIEPRHALRTGLIATASNPLTILTWGAVFSGAAAADVAATAAGAVAFVLGIGLGSLAFHLVLAGVAGTLGGRMGPRALAWTDAVSGIGLIGFGTLLGIRTVREG
ncbi:MAG: LysE family transporter [Actinomycetota bacterium]|nr:LysE family transporter [Actinomycetota bacterium]